MQSVFENATGSQNQEEVWGLWPKVSQGSKEAGRKRCLRSGDTGNGKPGREGRYPLWECFREWICECTLSLFCHDFRGIYERKWGNVTGSSILISIQFISVSLSLRPGAFSASCPKISNERWNITTAPTDGNRKIRAYYKQLRANKFKNLGEVDKVLKWHKLPNVTEEESWCA